MSLNQETKYLIRQYDLRPDTARGQHFLVNDKVLAKIVASGNLTERDCVLEIGCGLGTLTTELAKTSRVVGFETDRRLQEPLTKLQVVNKRIKIFFEDVLKADPGKINDYLKLANKEHFKIIANIPYSITGSIMRWLFELSPLPELVVFLIQKEVAEKIVAQPGDHSKQSLGVQFYGQPKIIDLVSAASFWPVPEVDSAILVIDKIHPWNYATAEKLTWQIIRIGFSSKRKKLVNNLASGLKREKADMLQVLEQCQIDHNARAEDLTKENWLELAGKLG